MTHYIGIDIGKSKLDVDWMGSNKTYQNTSKGIEVLIKALKSLHESGELSLIVCEATGGYERGLIQKGCQANLPIHLASANRVRYFAKSQGLAAKTDTLDARVLSQYGKILSLSSNVVMRNKQTETIGDILKRRDQLQKDKHREQNKLDKWLTKETEASVRKHINWLDKEIKRLNKKLESLKQHEAIKPTHDLLTSIPAIGDLSAYALMAYLPELGQVSHKEISALVGVAPFNKDSGSREGKRFIQGGRSSLRHALYMSGISAIRCNEPLQQFYTRLRERGKPAKVAIVAVIRKLLTMANSVIKRQTPWSDAYTREVSHAMFS